LREADLNTDDYVRLRDDFTTICLREYELIELTSLVTEQAKHLLEAHTLRAYDAVQLTSALMTLQRTGQPALIFLSADERLLEAAHKENLPTDNPNLHP